MDFVTMQNELIAFRFNDGQRNSIENWINHRYAWVWAQELWPFKVAPPTQVTVTAGSPGSAYYASATDVLRPLALFDENGYELNYVTPTDFQRTYQGTTATGHPDTFTVINGVIYLGPTPSGAYTFTAPYERVLSHIDASVTLPASGADSGAPSLGLGLPASFTTGPMANDGDEPVWTSVYHYMLVLGATATGLKMENDPTWPALEEEFKMGYSVMAQELLPADRTVSLQYGRDT